MTGCSFAALGADDAIRTRNDAQSGRVAGPGNRAAAAAAAAAIHTAHERWIRGFEEITGRARQRFEQRDWRGAQADATARLALYRIHLDGAVADVRDILEDAVLERTLWAAVKARHFEGLAGRADTEVAQTFFNSVTRRIFSTVGADPAIEYLDPSTPPAAAVDPSWSTATSPPWWTPPPSGDAGGLPLVGPLRPARPGRRAGGRDRP